MSNRAMHKSTRLIGLVSIACAAVVFSAAPAGALIAFPEAETRHGQPGLHVSVGKKWEPLVRDNFICGEHFNYVQRMTIDGVSMMVPTQFLYAPGRYDLVLYPSGGCGEGESYFIYAVATGTGEPV